MKPLAAAVLLLAACATPGPARKAYFLEDGYARYYASSGGRTLRVEGDGSVLDVSCLPVEIVKDKPLSVLPKAACPDGRIPLLGKARRAGDDWDMSEFDVEPDTGGCAPLLEAPDIDGRYARPRRSCWNRLWEVPTAVVGLPLVLLVAVGVASAPVWVPLVFFR